MLFYCHLHTNLETCIALFTRTYILAEEAMMVTSVLLT